MLDKPDQGRSRSRVSVAASRRRSRPAFGRRGSSVSASASASDGDDVDVPHREAFLDNRLPLEYFKRDVLALVHGLQIPGWRLVEAVMAPDLVVTRMSGALTNAIYSVEHPPYLRDLVRARVSLVAGEGLSSYPVTPIRMPPKLLLRVYGPQVSHLIDRTSELKTLARLARRHLGPSVLGTFANGRFEQFLDARPLTKQELWDPDVGQQIAKRMRELHDGVRLIPEERAQGPVVWVNIRKWMPRAVEVLQSLTGPGAIEAVLQTDLATFQRQIDLYQKWLYEKYQGPEAIARELVFSHNDTQYGNILRFLPPRGSPLLSPKYEHRQLVVIDFEYSGPNVRGYDLANHFCEWMSDYHDECAPHAVHHHRFPTREQQLNLIQAYVEHGYDSFDDEESMQHDVDRLLAQSRDWRPAVHIYWCLWGIVQAPTNEEKDQVLREKRNEATGLYKYSHEDEKGQENADAETTVEDEPDTFDYLAYSAEKAKLFWADMQAFGLMDLKGQ